MRNLMADAHSVLHQQGCPVFDYRVNGLWSTSDMRRKDRKTYEPQVAFNRNRLEKFETDLTEKIVSENRNLDCMKKCVRRMFLLTTAPLILLFAATYTAADYVHPIVLKPITREIPNGSTRFTYSTALVEASHIAFLAEQGRSIAAYRDTFSHSVNWLQAHPHSWYWYRGNNLVHRGTQYHISNHGIYMARLDNALRIPYSRIAQNAMTRNEQNEHTLWNTAYTSAILSVLCIFIEALMLFYVYIGRNKINMVNLERKSTGAGRISRTAR